MRIVQVSALNPRTIEKFGSRGFTIGTLCPGASVAAASLEANGRIGPHPAVEDHETTTGDGARVLIIEGTGLSDRLCDVSGGNRAEMPPLLAQS